MSSKVNIGDCDTCDYALKCCYCTSFSKLIVKGLFGCPPEIVRLAMRDMEKEKDESH